MKNVFADYRFEGRGLKNRLAQMFNKESGRTVMLAIDHDYFQGAIPGLEDIQKTISPLLPYCDAFSPSVGTLENSLDPNITSPLILRATGGNSTIKTTPIENEHVTVSIDTMLSMNAIGYTVSYYHGTDFQSQTMHNLTSLINGGGRQYGLIAIGITAVGRDYEHLVKGEGGSPSEEDKRQAFRYIRDASRILSANGANIIKTYYVDGFEDVVNSCSSPIVIAGGTKRDSTEEVLDFTYRAIQAGAIGVDMGRNIFQDEHPVAMIQAIKLVVHEGYSVDKALKRYNEFAKKGA